MTFHPQGIDPATLRRLAKTMKTRASEVLPSPLTLSQSQELLARAMGHADWHQAIHAKPNAEADANSATPQDPFLSPACRLRWYSEMSELMALPDGSTTSSSLTLQRRLEAFCASARRYGRASEAERIEHSLLSPLRESAGHQFAEIVADFLASYSQSEAMALSMLADGYWSPAFAAAARQAERVCDEQDYIKLGSSPTTAAATTIRRTIVNNISR